LWTVLSILSRMLELCGRKSRDLHGGLVLHRENEENTGSCLSSNCALISLVDPLNRDCISTPIRILEGMQNTLALYRPNPPLLFGYCPGGRKGSFNLGIFHQSQKVEAPKMLINLGGSEFECRRLYKPFGWDLNGCLFPSSLLPSFQMRLSR
jgi:hypothetical protein